MMNAICERIEAECVVTPIAWEGIIPALNTGKIDMIIGSMTITLRALNRLISLINITPLRPA